MSKLTIVSVVLFFSVSLIGSFSAAGSEDQTLPTFRPTAKDKPLEKFYKEPKQADPLPASEIANIILPLSFLQAKDMDPREEVVKVTITNEWLQKPILKDGEPIFVLRIPIKMLEILDENPDPNLITFSYPLDKFEFYRSITELSSNMQISLADLAVLNDTELLDKLNSNSTPTRFQNISGLKQTLYAMIGLIRMEIGIDQILPSIGTAILQISNMYIYNHGMIIVEESTPSISRVRM